MKIAIIILVWAASLFCAYRGRHIVSNRFDYSAPSKLKAMTVGWSEGQIATNHWLRNPRFRMFGKFVLMRPADRRGAGLVGGVLGNPPHSSIWVFDDAKSGRPREFTFCDAAMNSVTVGDKNGDGLFEVRALFNRNGC